MNEQSSENNQHYMKEYSANQIGKRNYDMFQVAGSIQKITMPIFKQKSIVSVQLIPDWIDIIGHHYGNLTYPHRLVCGTLTIACSSTTAAEMQYITTNIMQKINLYYGQSIVKNIKFLSNRAALTSLPKKRLLPIKPPPSIKINNFPTSPLQEALAKLGGNLQRKIKGK